MPDIKWIKITTNIFDDEKMLLIDSLPDRDSLIVIWFKILTLAGKTNNSGILMLNDKIPYTDEMLATIFRRPLNTVRLALETFQSFDMIEMQNNSIMISNWEKHQNIDGMDKIRKQTQKRVARHRAKQQSLIECNVTGNVTVTDGNAIDKDKEEDKDKNKNINKETFISLINDFTSNNDLKKALKEYVKMRKSMSKGFTTYAFKRNLTALSNLQYSEENMIICVNRSIESSWKSFFELKNLKKQKTLPAYKRGESTKDDIKQSISDEEAKKLMAELKEKG